MILEYGCVICVQVEVEITLWCSSLMQSSGSRRFAYHGWLKVFDLASSRWSCSWSMLLDTDSRRQQASTKQLGGRWMNDRILIAQNTLHLLLKDSWWQFMNPSGGMAVHQTREIHHNISVSGLRIVPYWRLVLRTCSLALVGCWSVSSSSALPKV